MNLEEFLREQHKRIGILKRTLRGRVAARLFEIQRLVEEKFVEVYSHKGLKNTDFVVCSCSLNQIATKLGICPDRAQPYVFLAAALGLVTRIEEHQDSAYYGELGICVMQYKLELVKPEQVRERWRIWDNRAIRNLRTISDIRSIFGNEIALSVDVRPEARDMALRHSLKERRARVEKKILEDVYLQRKNLPGILAEPYERILENLPESCGYRYSYLLSRWRKINPQETIPD